MKQRGYIQSSSAPIRSATVSSTITAVRAPTTVPKDAQFKIEVDITTSGTGSDKQFLAIYDSDAAMYIGAGKSDEPIGPGVSGTWTATMNPLNDWYTSVTGKPIPSTLHWIARVGYVTKENPDGSWEGMITDERSFSMSTTGGPTILCEDYTLQSECEAAGCYWWGGACHSNPQSFLDKYKYYLIAAGAAGMVGLVIVASR